MKGAAHKISFIVVISLSEWILLLLYTQILQILFKIVFFFSILLLSRCSSVFMIAHISSLFIQILN